jgi:hypothetical protein
VQLVLHAEPDRLDWLDAQLAAVSANGMRAIVALPLPEDALDPALAAAAAAAELSGHELAVRLDHRTTPRDPERGLKPLRAPLRALRQAGTVRTVITPSPVRATEPLLARAGFRSILLDGGPATAAPRPALVFEGQPRVSVVLQAGPYSGPCGTSPRPPVWSPLAADRATQALHGAARSTGAPTLRVTLAGTNDSAAEDAALTERWLRDVVKPSGAHVTTAAEARVAAFSSFRNTRPDADSANQVVGGRLVSVEEIQEAAVGLTSVNALPRELPGDLSPTEAFLAFALYLSGELEGDVVRLGALEGPPTNAVSSLITDAGLEREAVVKLASIIVADLPKRVPAAVPCDGRLLTATEALLAFASAVRGDAPATTRPVTVPEPNEPGLGWGSSTLP